MESRDEYRGTIVTLKMFGELWKYAVPSVFAQPKSCKVLDLPRCLYNEPLVYSRARAQGILSCGINLFILRLFVHFFLSVRSIHHFYLYCFVTILFEKKAFNLLLMAYE